MKRRRDEAQWVDQTSDTGSLRGPTSSSFSGSSFTSSSPSSFSYSSSSSASSSPVAAATTAAASPAFASFSSFPSSSKRVCTNPIQHAQRTPPAASGAWDASPSLTCHGCNTPVRSSVAGAGSGARGCLICGLVYCPRCQPSSSHVCGECGSVRCCACAERRLMQGMLLCDVCLASLCARCAERCGMVECGVCGDTCCAECREGSERMCSACGHDPIFFDE
eukprot:TRINITY_DN1393_c2_g1_i1.p1 TRINITY_DN1393_c2_g1~~TRINITY_DN1393_c2_g1_i1.p1  ORF type:complete len:221 (+),score=52.84 TRINITY_DN1393_c2_g1_i1:189-851(+)